MYHRICLAGMALALASVGCAKKSETATTPQPAAAPTGTQASSRRSANVITAAELQGTTVQNLYQAIQVLRPQWLRSRGLLPR